MRPEILGYYAEGNEDDRLGSGAGLLELLRTQDVLRRALPEPPARVLDVGGGTGVHARWLAQDGYEARVVDPVRLHVEKASAIPGVTAALGDARELHEAAESWDAVLLLGPLYHLTDATDRLRALREAVRVVRLGGVVLAAAISRFASFHDGFARGLVADPLFVAVLERDLVDGQHRNDAGHPEWFTTAYFHHPDELRAEFREAGLAAVRVVAVEGALWLAPALDDALADPRRRELMLRLLEGDPSLLGASTHLLAVARRPWPA